MSHVQYVIQSIRLIKTVNERIRRADKMRTYYFIALLNIQLQCIEKVHIMSCI